MAIPTQCPECGAIAVSIMKESSFQHEGDESWMLHAKCDNCGEDIGQFESDGHRQFQE